MKKVVGAAGVFAVIVLISTMIKWNYIIDFMYLSVTAAEQIATGQEVSAEFRNAVDNLSVGQFVNIPFFNEYMEERGIKDDTGESVTMEKTVDYILGEE